MSESLLKSDQLLEDIQVDKYLNILRRRKWWIIVPVIVLQSATQAAPLVQRCLAAQPVELNFLYQDLFYGAKEQGMAEYAMLQNNLGNALQYASSSHTAENNLRALDGDISDGRRLHPERKGLLFTGFGRINVCRALRNDRMPYLPDSVPIRQLRSPYFHSAPPYP